MAYRAGRLPLNVMIKQTYALHEINAALDDLEQRRVLRPLIMIDASLCQN